MKVYLATAGEYSDYRVCHVFARREDAEAYPLGDEVEEREIREGPVEVGTWHTLWWEPGKPDRRGLAGDLAASNPWRYSDRADKDNRPPIQHEWTKGGELRVQGWDRRLVTKVYREQRAQYEARKAGVTL